MRAKTHLTDLRGHKESKVVKRDIPTENSNVSSLSKSLESTHQTGRWQASQDFTRIQP